MPVLFQYMGLLTIRDSYQGHFLILCKCLDKGHCAEGTWFTRYSSLAYRVRALPGGGQKLGHGPLAKRCHLVGFTQSLGECIHDREMEPTGTPSIVGGW